ncbi:hypothetical protein LXL04_014814 [Taraxacum kok-saghyz]
MFLKNKNRFSEFFFFFAIGLIFERFLAPRSRFFEKVNGLGVIGFSRAFKLFAKFWHKIPISLLFERKGWQQLLLDAQMQTPKTSTKTSSEGSRKISPRSISSDTGQKSSGRTARQLKTTGLEPNSSSLNQPTIRTPKRTTPVIVARRSPQSPISEKKRPVRVAELETQISQLKDDLKNVKDELVSSESRKDQAKQDAEEARKQLLAMSSRLDESQKLLDRSYSDKTHGIQDVDEVWISKLESAKKLHSADLDSLANVLDEINQLQIKLDGKVNSKDIQSESAIAVLHSLKATMAETLSVVETMETELKNCRISEFRAQEVARETLLELETAKKTMESLKFDQSKARESENADEDEIEDSKSEEVRFNEEESRKRMEIARVKLSELEDELKKSNADIEELKENLMDKETELQGICEENEELNSKLKNFQSGKRENELENEITNLKHDFDFLRSKLTVMETELKNKSEENEKLKVEITKINKIECKDTLGNSESDTIMKVDNLVAEIEKSNRKVARVVEELAAAQAANGEMEADLRKMKVQSDQWRKAAEAAATMLSGNNVNRKLVARTWSMDNCTPGRNAKLLKKKKNGNVLKRIGVLWKNPQNKRH